MPNWCSNYVIFTGSEDAIANLTQAINTAIENENKEKQGQVLTGVMQDGYFFDLYLSEQSAGSVTIMYETRWAPNIPDVALTCKTFGVEAEHDYNEAGMDIYGTAMYKADGTYEDDQIDQRFLDLVWYDDDNDIYVYIPTDERNECREELIDKYYPIWKAEQPDFDFTIFEIHGYLFYANQKTSGWDIFDENKNLILTMPVDSFEESDEENVDLICQYIRDNHLNNK